MSTFGNVTTVVEPFSLPPDLTDEEVRAYIRRLEREYVSRLWAEDWDSPEDAEYDDLGNEWSRPASRDQEGRVER